ncbi:MAG: hypothetical protein HN509_03320 [Halobacteriovoraceae bacterium]|jgi:predicted alpha/beta superfamily hydrolase|nr:hypothetical protein [Halobacteriovoraceae bacterium]MBT5092939.1 hypothetical protein [Halobacteriovoraceae bacterium]
MQAKFIFGLLLYTISNAYSLELVVNIPPNTPEGQKIYLTGDIPGKCYWEADCLQLEKLGPGNYKIDLAQKDLSLSFPYKITRGSWQNQAATSRGEILPNRTFTANEKNTISVANWSDLPAWKKVGAFRTHRDFYSPQLKNQRDITVWLPPSYRIGKGHYPVLYMHDGQNLFDPNTNMFGNEWGVDETSTQLIESQLLRGFIVVGIPSGSDRNGEYTYRKKGKHYARFLIDTLKPFIDQNYRTRTERQHTMVMGSSMGALISFTLVWKHGDTFSKGAGLSLPVFAHEYELYKFLKENPIPSKDIRFYFDHGGKGQDSNYSAPAQKFVEDLTTVYQFPAEQFSYRVFPYADHTELDWARRLKIPLTYLLKE